MQKLLTLAVALSVLIASTDLSIAQQPKEKKPAGEEKKMDKSSPKLMTGKVTKVDVKARTFTVVAKGKEYRFTFQKIEAVPKIGDIVELTYTESTGGLMEAVSLNSSKSNAY